MAWSDRLTQVLSNRSWQQLLSPLGAWLPKEPKGLVVLSMDGRWLKLLHGVHHRAHFTATAVLATPIADMNDEALQAWLKEAARAHDFHGCQVMVAHPSHLTTTRLFTLPSVNPKEIWNMVELQAEKHTPHAKDEIITDFQLIETDKVGYSRVLLVIAHQETIYRGIALLDRMGWSLSHVGLELEGLVNWFRSVRNSDAYNQGTLVAEFDHELTTLAVVYHDRPYFHRSLPLGLDHLISDPSAVATKFQIEFQRSLKTFQGEGTNITVSQVALTGSPKYLEGLASQIQQALELPTSVIPSFQRHPLTDKAKDQMETLHQVSFASLLGLAGSICDIDLTPKPIRLQRAFEKRAKTLTGIACQLLAGLLLLCSLVIGKAHKDERTHARLLREHREAAEEAHRLETLLERIRLVKEWLTTREEFLNVLATLQQHTPPSIRWQALGYTQGAQLTLKGISEEMPKVYDLAAALRSTRVFSNVEARRVTKRDVEGQAVTEFELVCSLSPSGENDEQNADAGG